MNQLPNDALLFIRERRQLNYDANESSVGRIVLKEEQELTPSILCIRCYDSTVSDDPYFDLDGTYQVEVIDLVKHSDDYDPTGLFCWITNLKRYGCVDTDHGTILTFPIANWQDIVQSPVVYLDAQWGTPDGKTVSEPVLPWLFCDFRLSDRELVLKPYPSECSLHHRGISRRPSNRATLFKALRRRELSDWLRHYLADFPYSGVKVNDFELLCCDQCRSAEESWFRQVFDAIEPREAKSYSDGWVQCPGCGIRFSTKSEHSFANGIHIRCGQKIRVID
jgi:hypothetical protein